MQNEMNASEAGERLRFERSDPDLSYPQSDADWSEEEFDVLAHSGLLEDDADALAKRARCLAGMSALSESEDPASRRGIAQLPQLRSSHLPHSTIKIGCHE